DLAGDGDGIHSPAGAASPAVVGANAPAQLHYLARGGSGQIDEGICVARNQSAPRLTAGERAGEAAGNRLIVSAARETSAGSQDIGEGAGSDLDFEYATVVADAGVVVVLEVEPVLEGELTWAEWQRD